MKHSGYDIARIFGGLEIRVDADRDIQYEMVDVIDGNGKVQFSLQLRADGVMQVVQYIDKEPVPVYKSQACAPKWDK